MFPVRVCFSHTHTDGDTDVCVCVCVSECECVCDYTGLMNPSFRLSAA